LGWVWSVRQIGIGVWLLSLFNHLIAGAGSGLLVGKDIIRFEFVCLHKKYKYNQK
jgi:hypothetical protein